MRITGLESSLFAPAGAGAAGCLVELLTDTGPRGVAIGVADLRTECAALVRRFLRGEDPRAAPALWQRMVDGQKRAAGGKIRAAMALLDLALWDLKARANEEPLWKTLGGARPAVPIVDPETTRPWTPTKAIRRLRKIEHLDDVPWVTLAANRGNARELRKVSDSVRAAVCAGRGLRFPDDFCTHFKVRSIDLVQVDLAVNGITGALQLADAAFGLELPVMLCGLPGNTQVHLAGALPYVMNAECTARPAHAPYSDDVRIGEGRAIAGDLPGNGLAVDRAALARCRVARWPARRRAT